MATRVTFTPCTADNLAYAEVMVQALERPCHAARRHRRRRIIWTVATVPVFAALGAYLAPLYSLEHESWRLGALLGVCLWALLAVHSLQLRSQIEKTRDTFQAWLTQPLLFKEQPPWTIEVSPTGVLWIGQDTETKQAWSYVEQVMELPAHIVLCWEKPEEALIVPRAAFASERDATEFATAARTFHEASGHDQPSRIKQFLAQRDLACDKCGYNLRGLDKSACPECGAGLSMLLLRTWDELKPRARQYRAKD